MMALVRRNMQQRLTRHYNKVVFFMHLLVFYKDIYQNARSNHQDSFWISIRTTNFFQQFLGQQLIDQSINPTNQDGGELVS
jgi:hypothetical protein